MNRNVTRAAVAALGFCACASPATAQQFTMTKETRVNVRDLDFGDDRDVEKAINRVGTAVAYVCDVPEHEANADGRDECVMRAWAGANEQLDRARRMARPSLARAEQTSSTKR